VPFRAWSAAKYLESWAYLLLDFSEAAFSVAIGYVVAARLLRPRFICGLAECGGYRR
jgi:hypothetical protein